MVVVEILLFVLSLSTQVLANAGDQILFSNRQDIRRFNFGLQNYTLILGGLEYVRSLDYDYKEGKLFFISLHNSEKTMIQHTSFVDQNVKPKTIVDTMTQLDNDLKSLSVDWLTKKIYYTDLERKRVEVANYDGTSKRVIVSTGLIQPEGLALFPQKGLMFITDWGSQKKIERFNMDGSNRKVIHNEPTGAWGRSITIDYEASLIYWGDTKSKQIHAMTIDGKVVKKFELQHPPNYISVSSSMLYWSDGALISGISKSSNGNGTIHMKDFQISDLRVFESYRQPEVTTPCDVNNGNCSHLCLLKYGGYTCACPTGVSLKEDNKTCEDGMKKFLIIARKFNIRLLSFDADESVDFRLDIAKQNIQMVHGVIYDVEYKRVYWTNYGCAPDTQTNQLKDCSQSGSINSIFINGTGFKQFLTADIEEPDQLACDWVARNIYWTDGMLGRIEVARLDGTARKVIISKNLQRPRGIAIDAADAKIYWSDWGDNPKIERADMNGDNREVLVDSRNIVEPNCIALDTQHRRLYWVDSKKYTVSYIDLYETTRKVRTIYEQCYHPFGITIFEKYAYWTDWSRKLYRMRITDKKNHKERIIIDVIKDVMGVSSVDSNLKYSRNPCYYKTNNCSHFCFVKPTKGRAMCECPSHMELGADERTCKVPSGYLVYSTNTEIHKTSIDTFNFDFRLLSEEITNHAVFSIDFKREKIIWYVEETQGERSSIRSAYLNGTNVKTVMHVDSASYDIFTLDWISGNIYLAKSNYIEVVNHDGTFRKKLIYNENLMNPKCIMVDPRLRKLYWIQKRNGSYLYQSNLDGTEIEALVKMNPDICAVDFNTGVIYCLSNHRSLIAFDPVHRNMTVIRSYVTKWTSLAIFHDTIIFTDYSSNVIGQISTKPTNQEPAKDLLKVDQPFGVQILHRDVQIGTNACFLNNGGCQQFCFAVTEKDVKCGCATHYALGEDGQSCVDPQSFLIANQKNNFIRILFADGVPDHLLPVTNATNVDSIAFDYIRDKVYWLDKTTNQIHCINQDGMSGFSTVNLINKKSSKNDIQKPFDFALDPFSNSLFWTDAGRNTINFYNIHTGCRGIVFNHKDYSPRKIVVRPEIGRLFWTSADESKSTQTDLVSISFAGTDKNDLASLKRSKIVDLVIDDSSQLLYYLDTEKNKIVSMSLQGQVQFQTLIEAKFNPASLATNEQDIFWGDNHMIYKVSKSATNQNSVVFHGRYESLSEIIAVNTSRKNFVHPCINNNGGCSHICRISYEVSLSTKNTPPKAICGCPINYRLNENHKNCSIVERCQLFEIFCKEDSRCIPSSKQCDSRKDCSDGQDEDESICEFPKAPCPSHYRQCGAIERCVKKNQWCDGVTNCPNGEDETNCIDVEGCEKDEFMCENGVSCISSSLRCNGDSDCLDGSDENDCPEPTLPTQYPETVNTLPSSEANNSNMLVAVISGIIVSIIVIMVGILFYIKIKNSKKNHANAQINGGHWALQQLKPLPGSDDHAKSSVSTYISNDLSYYDRNNMTGQSENCDSEFSQLIFNPPPSPVTERAMSTMTDTRTAQLYNDYNDTSNTTCDLCHRDMEEESLDEGLGGGHDAPPPTIVSSLDDVDLYYPITKNNDWSQKSTICDDCQSTIGGSQAESQPNGRLRERRARRHDSNGRPNGHLRSIHENMSEMDTSWMYDNPGGNQYGEESLFIDSNGHLYDPPPSPCTYLSEEDRPPSPTFSALHGREHFAPPPSPTSQLL